MKPIGDRTEKSCNRCRVVQPLANFHNSKHSPDGKQYRCKPCAVITQKTWQAANPEKMRLRYNKADLKRHYGMTPEGFQRLLEAQGGTCAFCPATDDKGGRGLHVDHCHETGKVRGLLCGPHNRGLGMFNDSVTELINAVLYLRGLPPITG